MNDRQLSLRLERVASYLSHFKRIADIGSDHAYLPCYLALRCPGLFAIAGELNEGPYQSACAQVRRSGLSDAVEVRKGNGLEVLNSDDDVEAIAIAGMGGPLIASILEDGKTKLRGVQTLVLQPNIAAHAVREWLSDHEFSISAEEIIEEDGKIYEIIVAVPEKDPSHLTEADLLFGPILRHEQAPAFQKKWRREQHSWLQVLEELKKGKQTKEMGEKQRKLERKLQLVKEALEE
ncbi:tRNA (adenine(22)-N(1))-methyltransferase [Shouchella tritolerans]|uniref:tRNA (adenine(22)-N(1))-methyltransferase n=1 Tax=Shouchella tritolerans TaxID=2979466 RepID=UPI0021E823C7|nr:tRNA (adenine(22)-N(1))-methyltransferase TrmK [Shouchella tritolerans]